MSMDTDSLGLLKVIVDELIASGNHHDLRSLDYYVDQLLWDGVPLDDTIVDKYVKALQTVAGDPSVLRVVATALKESVDVLNPAQKKRVATAVRGTPGFLHNPFTVELVCNLAPDAETYAWITPLAKSDKPEDRQHAITSLMFLLRRSPASDVREKCLQALRVLTRDGSELVNKYASIEVRNYELEHGRH